MTSRTSLTRFAPLMQDARPMSESERRRLLAESWHEMGDELVGFQRCDVPEMLWDLLTRYGAKLYGERERRT